MPKPTDKCQVYYISDESCTDAFDHGYVGLTAHPESRLRVHSRSGRSPSDFKITILHEAREPSAPP
jgi:hypothetical protein